MRFITFVIALVCLYALVQAKENLSPRRESPLRKVLRIQNEAQAFVVTRPAVVSKTIQRQPVLTRQVQLIRQAPVVVRQEPTVLREEQVVVSREPTVLRQEPVLTRQVQLVKQAPVVVRQEPTVLRQENVVLEQQQQDQQGELFVLTRVAQPREYNVIRQTRPVEVLTNNVEVVRQNRPVEVLTNNVEVVRQNRPVEVVTNNVEVVPTSNVELVPTNVEVVPTNVEVVQPLAIRPVVSRRVAQPVVVEQVEQGADNTDEQELVNEPAPLRRVEEVRKLDVPQQNRRKFNVLLRTASGFNEKAGYSVSSTRTLQN